LVFISRLLALLFSEIFDATASAAILWRYCWSSIFL
jgi:hypothetical protein